MFIESRKDEMRVAREQMWYNYWKDVYDKCLLLGKVYASEEYIDRFGTDDVVKCINEARHAKIEMDRYKDRIEEYTA